MRCDVGQYSGQCGFCQTDNQKWMLSSERGIVVCPHKSLQQMFSPVASGLAVIHSDSIVLKIAFDAETQSGRGSQRKCKESFV